MRGHRQALATAICSLIVGVGYVTVAIANPQLAKTIAVGYIAILATCTAIGRYIKRR